MQDCLFPNLGIVRNMKPTVVFFIFHSQKGIRTQTHWQKNYNMFGHISIPYQSHEKILCFQQYYLSEIWANTKLNLLICLLPICHLFLCGFNWWRINWRYVKKLWPVTIDHSGDNEDSISFFIFSYLQWNMITTKLTSIFRLE